MSDQVHHKMNF